MKKKYDLLTGLSITIYISLFSAICFLKYRAFDYHDFDLALQAQILWNILHGSIDCSLLGVDFLGNHAYFIFFFLAPIYAIFAHPFTLLFIQTLALGLTALPLYLISKKELGDSIGFMVVVMYLIYPALAFTNLDEFHVPALATLFLMYMYYFFYRNNFLWFTVFMFLALLCQENMSFAVFMVGLLAIFSKKEKKFIFIPLLLSIFWFFICFFLVIPYFNRGRLQMISFYAHLGSSIPMIIFSFVNKPLMVAHALLRKRCLIYLAQLFVPLSFVPLIGFRYIVVIVPFIFQHLSSLRFTEQDITRYYAAEMLPFIFLGFIYGIKRLMGARKAIPIFLKSFLLLVSVFCAIYIGPLIDLVINYRSLMVDGLDIERNNFVRKIPQDKGAVATFEFLPKLANRRYLFSFHNVSIGYYPFSERKFVLPKPIEYALIDFNDQLTRSFNNIHKEESVKNMQNFVENPEWGIIEIADAIVLFKKGEKKKPLYRIMDKYPELMNVTKVNIDGVIELLGYRLESDELQKLNIVFYWRSLTRTPKDINIYFDIVDSKGRLLHRRLWLICYGVYPTFEWKAGQIIEDRISLVVPVKLDTGIYLIKLGFVKLNKDLSADFIKWYSSDEGVLDKAGRLILGKVIVK